MSGNFCAVFCSHLLQVGLVEQEWLDTLANINPEEVTFIDFIEAGRKLGAQLKQEVGCKIWDAHSSAVEDSSLLGCYSLLLVNSFFQSVLTSCFLPKRVILCGYETVSHILKEKSICMVCGNKVQNIWMVDREVLCNFIWFSFHWMLVGW